jgi:intracellular multiplication protein IcmT
MDLHWRNTQKPARFFVFDARSAVAIFIFMVHIRLWTLALAVITILIFWVMERRGLTFEAALRAFRVWILGRRRPGTLREKRRRWVDFG